MVCRQNTGLKEVYHRQCSGLSLSSECLSFSAFLVLGWIRIFCRRYASFALFTK